MSFSKLKVENLVIISDWPKIQLVFQIFIHQIFDVKVSYFVLKIFINKISICPNIFS